MTDARAATASPARPGEDGLPVWSPAPEEIPSPGSEVHVWLADLEGADLASLGSILSAEEIARADGFRFAPDRDAFVAARGILRTLLGRYVQRDPASLCLRVGGHGKPFLETETAEGFRFNVSHSERRALFAFTRGRELGVDLERVRPERARLELAERFFAPSEAVALAALEPEERAAAFFRCWTRKEAYLKARGDGLSAALAGFSVTLAADAGPALAWSEAGEAEVRRWDFRDVTPGDGWAAAVVARGNDWTLQLWIVPTSLPAFEIER